jgi:papain like protease
MGTTDCQDALRRTIRLVWAIALLGTLALVIPSVGRASHASAGLSGGGVGAQISRSAPAAALPAETILLAKHCSWSRRHQLGTRTCRYYRGKTLIKICVRKPSHRERCELAHHAPTVRKTALPAASPAAANLPAGATSTPAVAAPASGEQHALGALAPTQQVNPAPEATLTTLPASVDLSQYSVAVGNQGQIGSCVTWAIDYGLLGWYSDYEHRAGEPFNPMYTYSQIHLANTTDGGGSYAREALALAFEQGNDTMAHYSVKNTEDFNDQPTTADRANAANYKIADSQTLFEEISGSGSAADAATIKAALAQGKPVAIGMEVRNGFEGLTETSFTDNDTTGKLDGGHEVLATGYDETGLWIQNSWGTGWGYRGYGHLSWAVVEHDVFEAHTISGFAAAETGDTTAPVMGPVTARLYEHQITGTTVPVDFEWSATDDTGVTAYQVAVTANAGQTWASDTYSPADATAIARLLPFGGTYSYAVRARDAAGNWSGWAYSRPVTTTTFDDKSISTGSPWAQYGDGEAFGGTFIASNSSGASITVSFTGTDISWIAPTFATAGRANVYCDGKYTETIDLYSSSTVELQTAAACNFSESGSHTMKVENEGTAGRPWIAVDAFVILS